MKKLLIVCLVGFALLFGINWIQENKTPKQTQVYSLSDYAYSELEDRTIYKADDMTVVDSFAQKTHTVNGKVTNITEYYLVTYRDKNDRLVAGALSVDDDDSISFRLSMYASDDSQNIGDCVLNDYIKTKKNTNSELTQYYEDAIDKYGPILGEYLARSPWMFEYHCSSSTNPLK